MHQEHSSYWDITGYANPRKGEKVVSRTARRRKTATGMRQHRSSDAQTENQNHADQIGEPLNMDEPGTTG